jgi:hypothetical protein
VNYRRLAKSQTHAERQKTSSLPAKVVDEVIGDGVLPGAVVGDVQATEDAARAQEGPLPGVVVGDLYVHSLLTKYHSYIWSRNYADVPFLSEYMMPRDDSPSSFK